MRFNKRSRKLKFKKKRTQSTSLSFLIYLAAGILLLAIFYYVVLGGHRKELESVRQEKIRDDMDAICTATILFRQDHGRYPRDQEGIAALVGKVASEMTGGQASEQSTYLLEPPLDPWGTPYVYRCVDNGDRVSLASLGADRQPGGTGDAADLVRNGCGPSAAQAK